MWLIPTELLVDQVFTLLQLRDLVRLDTATHASKHRKCVELAFRRMRVLPAEGFADVKLSPPLARWLDHWSIVPFSIYLPNYSDEHVIRLVRQSKLEGCENLHLGWGTCSEAMRHITKAQRPVQTVRRLSISEIKEGPEDICGLLRRFPGLQSLRIDRCRNIDTTTLQFSFRNCPSLTDVRLVSCPVDDSTIALLASSCPRLTELVLVNADPLTDDSMVALAQHAKHLMKLQVLGLKSRITDMGVAAVCQGCPKLSVVALEGTRVTATALEAITAHLPTSLTGLKLTVFAPFNLPPATLTRLALSCTRLRSLQLTWQQLHDLATAPAALKSLTSLRVLTVHGRGRERVDGDQTVLALAESRLPLQELDLVPDCVLSEETWMALAKSCGAVTKLRLARCDTVTDAFVQALTATGANLSHLALHAAGNLTDTSLAALAEHCPALKQVDLPHCPLLTDDGAVTLLRGCDGRLESLSLINSDLLTDAFLFALAHYGRQLRCLYMGECGALTAAAVQDMAGRCRRLEALCVHAHVLSRDEARAVERDHTVRGLVVTRLATRHYSY